MNDRQRADEIRKLRRLSDVADRVAGDVWSIEADDRGMFIVSERFSGKRATVCKFGPGVTDDEIRLVSEAIDNLIFFLPLIARAAGRIRALEGELRQLRADMAHEPAGPKRWGDYAAQASILLSNGAFQTFLAERSEDGVVIDDKDAADAELKKQLGIQSKKQLNTEAEARDAWLSLFGKFEAWKTEVAA